jgi:Fe(3+) dicitrate transport protein
MAQSALTIQGVVKNEKEQPIDDVFVLLMPDNKVAYTNNKGVFTFDQLSTQPYQLTINAVGYQTQELNIDLQKNITDLTFTLQKLEVDFGKEVLVEEDEYHLNPAISGVTLLSSKTIQVIDLEKVLGNVAANNARELYKTIPGLNIWENDNSGIQLNIGGRGLNPNRTSNFNTRQNGYDISADALGYPETYYTPPAQAVKNIQVLRGAASLQFGTQFGGMLNFVLKEGAEDRRLEWVSEQTYGSFNFFNSFNSLGGSTKDNKFNYYAFYQYKRGDGWRPNASFEVHNGYAQLQFRPHKKWNIKAEQTIMQYLAHQPGGLTDLEFEQDARQSNRFRNWFRVNWNLSALTVDYKINPLTQFNLRLFGLFAGRQSLGNLQAINRPDYGGPRDLIQGKYANVGGELRFLHRYPIGKRLSALLTGIRVYRGQTTQQQGLSNEGETGTWADFTLTEPNDGILRSDYQFPSWNLAAFAEHLFSVSERFSITPGVRLEYIQTQAEGYYQDLLVVPTRTGIDTLYNRAVPESRFQGRAVFLAGVGASYKWNPNTELYANFSQNYKGINFNDMRIANPNQEVDPNLKDEYGYNADIGFKYSYKGLFNLNTTVFYLAYNRRIGNIQGTRPNPDNPLLQELYTLRTNVGNARVFGIEIFAEVDAIKLLKPKSPFSLTAFVNVSWLDGRYLETANSFAAGKQLEFVAPFIIRTGLAFSYQKLKLSYQYAYTAQHYTDATNAEWVPNAVVGVVPSYGVMDLSASYQWKWFTLQAGINNLADATYFTRRATSYPGPGILPADGRSFYVSLRWAIGVQ